MPNGKGFLDCRYCVYAQPIDGGPLLFGSKTYCLFHRCELPQPKIVGAHRFCIHFQASELYFAEAFLGAMFRPIASQFARFGAELDPGVLYEYGSVSARMLPHPVDALATLRKPDYHNRTWLPSA
jgi:hypothetical protein